MTPNIPIMAWLPDGDPTVPGVLSDIENMLPTRRGYAPEPRPLSSATYAVTLAEEPTGGQTITYKAGTIPFLATETKLYAFTGGAWNDVSSGTYVLTDANLYPWRFESFSTPSNDRIALAVSVGNKLQAKTDTTAAAFSTVTAAPWAASMAVQRNFVVLGNYSTGGSWPVDGWICSALEDYTDWTPDIATQCASGRLTATPGGIVRLIAYQDYVIAFKLGSMFRGTYVGAASNTWSWPVISRTVGLVSHDAVIEVDGVLYWLGLDGFYRWDGGQVSRIASAPWDWMRRQYAYWQWSSGKIQAVYDSVMRVVRFVFLGSFPGTTDNLCITYHPESDRWGRSFLPALGWVMTLPQATVRSAPYGHSVYADNGVGYMVKTGANYVLSTASGVPLTSSFTTGDIGDDEQLFVLTRARARFLSGPTGSAATHYYRMNLDEAPTTGDTASRTDGKYDFSYAARWHRLKFTQSGMYEVAGFSVETQKAGRR